MSFGDDVLRALQSGESLAHLGLERDGDGRWILDATVLEERQAVLPPARLHGVTVESVNFRGSRWSDVEVVDSVVTNCVFDDSVLIDWYTEASEWRECRFRDARLKEFNMSGARRRWSRPTLWDRVDFSRSDLRATFHLDERYVDCDFAGARLDAVDFQGSVHERSRFAGMVKDVTFRRYATHKRRLRATANEMRGVNFEGARLRFCGFWGIGLGDAILPADTSHLVFKPKVRTARSVLRALEADGRPSWSNGLQVAMERMVAQGPTGADALAVLDPTVLSGDLAARRRGVDLICREAEWVTGGDVA